MGNWLANNKIQRTGAVMVSLSLVGEPPPADLARSQDEGKHDEKLQLTSVYIL